MEEGDATKRKSPIRRRLLANGGNMKKAARLADSVKQGGFGKKISSSRGDAFD